MVLLKQTQKLTNKLDFFWAGPANKNTAIFGNHKLLFFLSFFYFKKSCYSRHIEHYDNLLIYERSVSVVVITSNTA